MHAKGCPSKGLKFFADVAQRYDLFCWAVNLLAIPVNCCNQVINLVVGSKHQCFPNLAFLQLSDPNVPSWGNLIGLGRNVLRVEWYVSAIPGVAILLTILGVSLVGQGLNDALNPRITGR